MPGYLTIRDAIKTVLDSVSNIGNVNDFKPSFKRKKDLETFLGFDSGGPAGIDQIRGWSITRVARTEDEQDHRTRFKNIHTFEIEGWMSLNNSKKTEETFQVLLDAISDAIRGSSGSGGIWEEDPESDVDQAVNWDPIDEVIKSDVFCHHAVGTMQVSEFYDGP